MHYAIVFKSITHDYGTDLNANRIFSECPNTLLLNPKVHLIISYIKKFKNLILILHFLKLLVHFYTKIIVK